MTNGLNDGLDTSSFCCNWDLQPGMLGPALLTPFRNLQFAKQQLQRWKYCNFFLLK
jgi:hypothetical protein